MPTYTWRCQACKHTTEVVNTIANCELPPEGTCMTCNIPTYPQAWTRIITAAPPVMWEDARDKGVFDRIYKV